MPNPFSLNFSEANDARKCPHIHSILEAVTALYLPIADIAAAIADIAADVEAGDGASFATSVAASVHCSCFNGGLDVSG